MDTPVALLLGAASIIAITWWLATQRAALRWQKTIADLNTDRARLCTQQEEREKSHQQQIQQFEEQKKLLKQEFENLANTIFEEKEKTFSHANQSSLDAILKPFKEQIDGFQKRVNDVHADTIKRHSHLETEIKHLRDIGLNMRDEASHLASALRGDKKTVGTWGEVQLERTLQLAGLTSGDHYEREANFKDCEGNNKRPDFVIKMPDNKHIIIDSKVSLVDYDRAIAANTETERKCALDAHVKAMRNHVDNLASKDYSHLLDMESPRFVFMFMAIEPAYLEAIKHNKNLFNDAYNKGIVMVSHTTLMPILKTVANVWMLAKSTSEAREIGAKAGDIYRQVCLVAERLQQLGHTLHTASKHYNNTVTALVGQRGLHGKIERFKQLTSSKPMPSLQPLHTDVDHHSLALVTDDAAHSEGS